MSVGTAPSRRRFIRSRLVGLAAIVFAVLWVTENVLFMVTGGMSYDAPIGDVLAYYAGGRNAITVISGLVALYLPTLLVCVAGLHSLVERRRRGGTEWSLLAVVSGAALSAVLVHFNITQIGLTLSAPGLAEPTSAFELMWQVHAAAFGLALPMAGTACIGMALATHASGLTPAWQRLLGLVGGSLLLVAGIGCLAIAEGSELILVGLLGFAAWVVWLVATGLRLMRTRADAVL